MTGAAADAYVRIYPGKGAVFFADGSPGALHDAEAAFDTAAFINERQSDLCFLFFCQRQPFYGTGGADFGTFVAIIVAKTLGIVNMDGGIILICFFEDFHGTVLHTKIAVEAAVGKVDRISRACGQNDFFDFGSDIFA